MLSNNNLVASFIKSELKYPEASRVNGVAGMVEVKIFFNKHCNSIEGITVLRPSDAILSTEVLRVVNLLKTWKFLCEKDISILNLSCGLSS